MSTSAKSWARLRPEALESVKVLVSLLDSEASQPRLVEGYLESKNLLAEAFQALLRERIAPRVTLLDDVKARIEAVSKQRFTGVVPEKYLRVAGYRTPHRELYAYLTLFVGQPIPSAVLRIITADAVHTERRARELRDLGLRLEATSSGGSDVYVLRSPDPDLQAGSLKVTALNIRDDKKIDDATREKYWSALGWEGD